MKCFYGRTFPVFLIWGLTLFLSCRQMKKVETFDYTNTVLAEEVLYIDSSALPPGIAFSSLADLETDSKGNLIVYEGSQYHIIKFDMHGKYVSHVGDIGQGPGEFMSPSCNIAIDRYDNLYITDPSNSRVQKLDSGGKYLGEFAVSDLQNIGVDSRQNLYVWPSKNRKKTFDKFSKDFEFVSSQVVSFPKPKKYMRELCFFDFDKDDNLYLASNNNRSVYAYDQRGRMKLQWTIRDTFLVNDIERQLAEMQEKIDSASAKQKHISFQITINAFRGLKIDTSGKIYILHPYIQSDSANGNQEEYHAMLYCFDHEGNFLYKVVGFSGVIGTFAISPEGDIYVLDYSKMVISRYKLPR